MEQWNAQAVPCCGAGGPAPGGRGAAPGAYARIRGGPLAPEIRGGVAFYPAAGGTLVCVDVTGLPPYRPGAGERAERLGTGNATALAAAVPAAAAAGAPAG